MEESLPRKLRVLRAERGWSLEQAAEKTGISRESLGLLERGKQHPRSPTLHKLAQGYGIPVHQLMEEPPAPIAQASPSTRPEGEGSRGAAYERLAVQDPVAFMRMCKRVDDALYELRADADSLLGLDEDELRKRLDDIHADVQTLRQLVSV